MSRKEKLKEMGLHRNEGTREILGRLAQSQRPEVREQAQELLLWLEELVENQE